MRVSSGRSRTESVTDARPEIRGIEPAADPAEPDAVRPLAEVVAEAEAAAIGAALRRADGNLSAAARALGIDL